ncbi:hypothetical protein T310_6671, partial [Rasamsonia emersonii CBS 393.64]
STTRVWPQFIGFSLRESTEVESNLRLDHFGQDSRATRARLLTAVSYLRCELLTVLATNVIHHRAGHTTELVSHNTNTEFLTITTTTTHHHLMADISREERLQLALQAYKKGQFPSIQKAADAFDVPKSTLITRVSGTTSRKDSIA